MRQAIEAAIGVLRPAIQADGGDLRLVGVDETAGLVQVELSGTCSGCSGQAGARSGGIERILADRVPGVRTVELVGGCGVPAEDCGTAVTL